MAWAFWPWFTRSLAGIIYLSDASQIAAETVFPALAALPKVVTPHGLYPVTASAKAQSNRTALVFFGGVSPYKRVGDLIRAFACLDDPALQLHIAGASSRTQPDADVDAALSALPSRLAQSVTRDDRFLSDDDLSACVHAARLVVLPFTAIQNSGSALYALSCGRPVLVPDLPVFRTLRAQVGTDWVHLFTGRLSADDLQTTLAAVDTVTTKPDLSAFEWPAIGAQTAAFYRQVRS